MSRSLAIVDVAHVRPGREEYHAFIELLNGRLQDAAREFGWQVTRFAADEMGAARLLERTSGADAIMVPGGEDIAPEYYGACRGYPAEGPHAERADVAQIALVHRALADGTPLLGICRGLHVINVALGGTLVQDLGPESSHVNADAPVPERMQRHNVEVVADSALAQLVGAGSLVVQSAHHQAVDVVAPGLRVVARASDGVVEAVEHSHAPILGVQWHSEALDAPEGQLATFLHGFLGGSVRRLTLPREQLCR
ncbi:gamma-glutamyl-gamma-aminobutyrate hydrolase family protein [Rathayibacter toxicus]|uniref:gamma-glutamyl-gamma-aminobutyrate hydrolase family protein n=1 Tax=Rathayibacter toxicus TaxID=145458 RepID=UPI001C05BE44|nr:gamma-glutamyl-gamma-aminobutyrate hydrolase family protein [Rathayibacter toxicus]QWL32749.1 gamma-glutamyl-gamma-aminobutyrate hydrolase family protein [Rathayibacter toxicus]QWL34844.1 gamma-glutamyl-gamma-aminobutyrate hydrolase family protein [Rathayibacter toxicus]QWL36975.1 gamma-glutamyl-gamma-aminobutyrate hydrolase family protein [Rathayibacter toxicus]QWL39067.1 gamma-glutamyl-gamma-aminobutyrate hydrolase family protein [Rathayibacter toxicus]QWL41153.1 gamma-glutamyl-gamma-amin